MNRVAFLDRDGTINIDYGYVHSVKKWRYTARAIEGLQRLRSADFQLVVVTNQSGIARGFYAGGDVERLHDWVAEDLRGHGIEVAAWCYCPHQAGDDCECRKPRIGMAEQAAAQMDLPLSDMDLKASWMIGDNLSDAEFGRRLGTRTALLSSRYWTADELTRDPDVCGDSLYEVACRITGQSA